MSYHTKVVSNLQSIQESIGNTDNKTDFWTEEAQDQILCGLIHTADVSNPGKKL